MAEFQPSRRTILRGTAFSGLALAFPSLASCSKQDAPTVGGGTTAGGSGGTAKLVSIMPTSGLQAEVGAETHEGLRLWLEQVDNKVGDLTLQLIEHDSQGELDTAVRRAREEMDGGAKILMGGALSNVALALGEEINRRGGVFLTAAGADEITGSECREGVFRTHVATWAAVRATLPPILEANPDLKKWYTITPDYAFGQALLAACEEVFAEYGVEHVGNSFHATDVTEFSSYLNNASAANPDAVCLLNFGAQSTTTLKQAASFGLTDRAQFVLVWSNGLTQFRTLGVDVLENVYAGCQYWHTAESPANQEFVARFKEASGGKNPGFLHAAGYTWGRIVSQVLEDTAPDDVAGMVKKLEGMEIEGLSGPERFRPEDHQLLKGYFLLRGRSKSDMQDPDDFMELLATENTPPPLDQVGCSLIPLGS